MGNTFIDPQFETYGWRTYVQNRRGTSKITISKPVAIGAGLEKGIHLYCYVAKDKDNRPMVVVYLDGGPKGRR